MQYVECVFPGTTKKYTYHNDGEPVKTGDHVHVATKNGNQTIKVVNVHNNKPSYPTKPIIGKSPV